MTNSNIVVELMSTLSRTHQTAKHVCGLAHILNLFQVITPRIWQAASGDNSMEGYGLLQPWMQVLVCVMVGFIWLRHHLMLLLDETLLLAALHCIAIATNCECEQKARKHAIYFNYRFWKKINNVPVDLYDVICVYCFGFKKILLKFWDVT